MSPQPPRLEVVQRLCDAAMLAMQAEGEGTTAEEIFSACLSIANQAVKTAVKLSANIEPMRQAITKIYAQFPPETVN